MKATYTKPTITLVETNVEVVILAASDTRIGIDGSVEIKDRNQFRSNRFPVWEMEDEEEQP